MELRQLRYFVAVVEESSFTRAAARLYVAQSGVSAQLRALERELGEALLVRTARAVRLTEAGEAVLPYARAALDAVEHAQLAVDELTGLVRGHVNVGTVGSIAALDLPGLLASFSRAHPAVEITLTEGSAAHLVDELHAGRLDMVLVGMAAPLPSDVGTQIVVDEEPVVAVAPDDPLAARPAVSVRALRRRSLISLPGGSGLRAWLEEACGAAGFQPRVAFEATDPYMLTRLAAQGMGVAVLPASVARTHAADLRTVALRGRHRRLRIVLAWSTSTSAGPAARALIQHARNQLPDLPSA